MRTPEEWAGSVKVCLRQIGPDEQPPNLVTDFPRQYSEIVRVIREAVQDEREACLEEALAFVEERVPIDCPDHLPGCEVLHTEIRKRRRTWAEIADAIKRRGKTPS